MTSDYLPKQRVVRWEWRFAQELFAVCDSFSLVLMVSEALVLLNIVA